MTLASGIMMSVSMGGEESRSFSSSSSSGDRRIISHPHQHDATVPDHENNERRGGRALLRDAGMNKSISFDAAAIRDHGRDAGMSSQMLASTNEIHFSFVENDVYDTASPSSSEDMGNGGRLNLHLASALSTATMDDCMSNSMASSRKSHKSHREKMLMRRKKLKNLKFLHSPMDLLSSSSSSSDDDDDDGEEEENDNIDGPSGVKTSTKLTDEMILSAICDLSTDESSVSSVSDICHCGPPSLMDHINISSASSLSSPNKNVRNSTCNNQTVQRKTRFRSSTPKRIKRRTMSSYLISGSPQELLLDLIKPPSLMDQISGKSDRGLAAGAGAAAGCRSSGSSNSLNSLSSEIFDLPESDDKVNEAANELVTGIDQLTRNADHTFPISDHRPEHQEEHDEETGSQDNLSLICNASGSSCPSTVGSSSTTYSIDASPIVSPLDSDSIANANNEEEEPELLADVSPISIMDYMRIAMTGSVGQMEKSLDELDAKSDFGVDDLPTDNTTTLLAGDSTMDKTLMDDSSGGNTGTTSYKTCGAQVASGEEISSSNSYYTDAVDDAFNDSSNNSEFKSAEDYERFLIEENAKLIAHTLVEIAYCTNSSATTDDFRSLISGSSFDVLDINDLSIAVSDEEEEESRATYNVSSSHHKKKASHDFDLTYQLEAPRITTSRSTGFMSSRVPSIPSSDTTYSLDPPPPAPSTAVPANASGSKGKSGQVKIRETRSSALRTERARKARSMEVRSTDFKPLSHSPSADSSRSLVRGTSSRQTFVRAVVRPGAASAVVADKSKQPVATSSSMQSMTAAATMQPASTAKSASKYQVSPSYCAPTTASKARTGVQAKFSAFLQRIRS